MKRTAVACFPFAGAGASVYRRWRGTNLGLLELVPIQMPGREERFREPLPATLQELAQRCADDLRRHVNTADAYVVLGHSFGAVVAYEVVRWLVSAGESPPQRLVVSGAAAPCLPRRHGVSDLTDDELVAHLRDLAGHDDAALRNPELRALLVPVLRADIALHEGYHSTSAEPLPVPIVALWGRDDQLVSRADMERWRDVTRAQFVLEDLPGGHMHIVEQAEAYWAAVERAVLGTSHEEETCPNSYP